MCPFIRTIEKTHSIDYFRWVKYILTKNNIFMKHDKTGAARVNRRECEPSPIDQRLQSSQVVMSGTCDKDRLYCHNTGPSMAIFSFHASKTTSERWPNLATVKRVNSSASGVLSKGQTCSDMSVTKCL